VEPIGRQQTEQILPTCPTCHRAGRRFRSKRIAQHSTAGGKCDEAQRGVSRYAVDCRHHDDLGAVAAPDVRWGIGAAAANTGFAKVVTAPAAKPLRATTIGPLASGAAPVIGLDGTVYIGNLNG
jgi:hypothetical protein